MPVYIRYLCPNCSQNLNLRLEYLNRRVVCKFCKHSFFSKAKLRVPESATPELAAAIEAINRGEAIGGEAGPADSAVHRSHVELSGSGDYPQIDGSGTGAHAAVFERPERSIAAPAEANPGPRPGFEPAQGGSAEIEDLRGELDRLLAQLETARSHADDAARVEAELRSARSECDQLRVSVKFLRADLARRAPDTDRLRARVAELERALAEAVETREREREQAEQRRVPAAELDRLKSHADVLAAERDTALQGAAVARRECAVHQSEAERLARELEQTRQEMGRIAHHGVELAEHLHQLGDELERQAREREAERQAHRKALDTTRQEWEARLRTAESAGRRKTTEETESLRAELEEVRTQLGLLRDERDAAVRLVEDLGRTKKQDAGRIAELEAQRDGIEARRLAAASEVEQLHERIAELERTRSGAPAPQAEAAIARREEERRALVVAAERLARERDNASAQLGETLLKLEDAQARFEALKSEVDASREAASSAQGEHVARQQECEKLRADAERLTRDLEKALKARAGEAGRGRQLAEKLKQLEAELAEARSKHEAETQAHQLAIEELQIRLKYQHRSGGSTPRAAITHEAKAPDAQPALPPPERAAEAPGPAGSLEERPPSPPAPLADCEAEPPIAPANGEAPEPDDPTTPLDLAFGPNAPESPDERIAALRLHLRKIHEAEEERINKRLLRRLTRVWRSDSK